MGNTASGESETEDGNQNTFIPPIEVQYEETIGSIQNKINKVKTPLLVADHLTPGRLTLKKTKMFLMASEICFLLMTSEIGTKRYYLICH